MAGRNGGARRDRVSGEPQWAAGRVLAPITGLSKTFGCSAPPVHASHRHRSARLRMGYRLPDLRLPADAGHSACVEEIDVLGVPLARVAPRELVAPR